MVACTHAVRHAKSYILNSCRSIRVVRDTQSDRVDRAGTTHAVRCTTAVDADAATPPAEWHRITAVDQERFEPWTGIANTVSPFPLLVQQTVCAARAREMRN